MASSTNREEAIDRLLRQGLFPEANRKDKKVILLSVVDGRMRLEEAAETMSVEVSLLRTMLAGISSGAQAQNAMVMRGLEEEEDEEQELGGAAAEEEDQYEEEEEHNSSLPPSIPELITPSPVLDPIEDSPTRGSDADENALPEPAKTHAPPVAAERPQTSRRVGPEQVQASEPIQAPHEPVQKASERAQSVKQTPKAAKNTPQSTPKGHRDDDEAGKDDDEVVQLPMTKTKARSIAVSTGYWQLAEGRSKRAIEIAFGRVTGGPRSPWHKDPVRKQKLHEAVVAALANRMTIMGAAQHYDMPYSTVHNNVKRTAEELKKVSEADEEAAPHESSFETAQATAAPVAAHAKDTPKVTLKRPRELRNEGRDQPMSSRAAYAHVKQPKTIAFVDDEEEQDVVVLPPLKKVKRELIDAEEQWNPVAALPAADEEPRAAMPRIWRDENRTAKLLNKQGRCGLRGTETQIRGRLLDVLKHGFDGDLKGMAEALMQWTFGTSLQLAATNHGFVIGELLKAAQFIDQFVDLDDCELVGSAPRRGSRLA
ncbi:hypothetical protein AAVH_24680 [Aphelenchoides avenae]|nr:hypothetical protein AAVH_24680 [Aphelenchus avenae]